MAAFNHMGSGLPELEANDMIEDWKLHRSDCSDTNMLYELCEWCNLMGPEPANNDFAARASQAEIREQAFNAFMNASNPHTTFSPGRTYAQVARSLSPMFMTHPPIHPRTNHVVQAQTQAQAGASVRGQEFQSIQDWMSASTYVPSSTSQDTSRSYAEVVQQPAQYVNRTYGTPQGRGNAQVCATPQQGHLLSSMRSPRSNPKQAPPNTASPAPRTQGLQSYANSRSMGPPQVSPHRGSFTGSLPQVPEGMMYAALQPERVSNPRDVGAFVQRNERGSQRNPSSLMPGPYASTPTSPGTLSEVSLASTRRTGEARYDPNYAHACSTCRHTFKSSEALKRHIRNVHTERPHHCQRPGCNQAFVFPKDLTRHVDKVHLGLDTEHFCPYCPKKYSRSDNLKRHIRSDHLGSDSGLGASMSRSTSYSGAHSMSRSTSGTSNNFAYSPAG